MRLTIPKSIRKTILTAFIILVVFIVGGVAYVYFGDKSNNKNSPPITTSVDVSPLPKPVLPSPNAKEGASVEDVISPVSLGENSSITASTNAGSTCSIVVSYNGVASTDSGLITKKADQTGTVTWTWTVGSSTPIGNWPIKVTCVYNGRSAVVDSSIQVTK